MTCDFQQCGILRSVDSDEPMQPPFKLRNSKWCSSDSRILKRLAKFWSDCAYAQADLRLCWSHIHVHVPQCWKSHVAAHILLKFNEIHGGAVAQWMSAWIETEGPRIRASPWARHIYPSLVLVQPKKTRPCLTDILLMGRKESNKPTNNEIHNCYIYS